MIQLTAQQPYSTTPADLARALWEASPEDFAEVFTNLERLVRGDEGTTRDGRPGGRERFDDFARAVATQDGFSRDHDGLRFVRQMASRAEFFMELRAYEKQKARIAADRPFPNQ